MPDCRGYVGVTGPFPGSVRVGAQSQVFDYTEVGEDTPVFRHQCQPEVDDIVGIRAQNISSRQGDRAFDMSFADPGHGLEQRGFPGAVCPKDHHDFTRFHLQRNVRAGNMLSVANREVADLNHRHPRGKLQ